MKKQLLAFIISLLCTSAFAQYFEGERFYNETRKRNVVTEALTLGYVMAVYDLTQNEDIFCTPEKIPSERLKSVALRYIEKNPNEAYKPAAVLIVEAFAKTWPCEKPSKEIKLFKNDKK